MAIYIYIFLTSIVIGGMWGIIVHNSTKKSMWKKTHKWCHFYKIGHDSSGPIDVCTPYDFAEDRPCAYKHCPVLNDTLKV